MSGGRFAIIPARALDDRELSKAAVLVLCVLSTYSNREGWCWPKQETVADRLGTQRQHVNRYISELKDRGYIVMRRTHRGSEYRIIHDNDVSISVTSSRNDVPRTGTTDVTVAGTQERTHLPSGGGGADAPLPEGYPGPKEKQWAAKNYPGVDIDAAATRFRAKYTLTGEGRRSWVDTWARWMKTAHKDEEHNVDRKQSTGPGDNRSRGLRHAKAAHIAESGDPFDSD